MQSFISLFSENPVSMTFIVVIVGYSFVRRMKRWNSAGQQSPE